MIPPTTLRPIRNVITLAVDEQHLRRTPPSSTDPPQAVDPIEFCVIKRTAIAMYSLRERLAFQKEIPLPSGGILARRTGRYLCIADKENYNMIDLEMASLIPLLPLSQTPDVVSVKPSITVISENEFLILSWTGTSTLGLFINGDGDPVRGTLEWPSHPESVCLDYPYITTLLPNNTIEIHSVETQAIMQVISAPLASSSILSQESAADRKKLVVCANGFLIPSSQRSDKLRRIPVRLVRTRGSQVTGEGERASELSEDNVAHMPEDAI
ncbi:hypothetical protein AcV5_002343 [Taiwanofungus camphoratus]|nr:hypothetical protein AcV5_002343 [Antrodia cinnamomea]